jgi:hypothetical protein
MITQSGPVCDVCGKYILPIADEKVHNFRIKGIDADLVCDNACKEILESAMVKQDWKALPEGPLRKAFSEATS